MALKHYISLVSLSPVDCAWLKITDDYSLHRIVCSLFYPNDQNPSNPIKGGILWRVAGYKPQVGVRILLLSDRLPEKQLGRLDTKEIPERFLSYDFYRFSVRINPTVRSRDASNPRKSGKIRAVTSNDDIRSWFEKRSSRWGFEADPFRIEIGPRRVVTFPHKKDGQITLFQVDLSGVLKVTDRTAFTRAFYSGIGRGKAFGCGLLQIVPVSNF